MRRGPDHVVDPATLILDLDDLAHRRPVTERFVLAAPVKPRADFDTGGAIEPVDTLQFRRAMRRQIDVGHQGPCRGDVTPNALSHFDCG